ncbi:MAG: hydantoinase B/oxoprolinase family protein [Alphaproteobacteria bacterium]|nr:hydantoinase B/oxoprolinase family protein [Alphaproteobacteria bacterium]
MRTWVDRGGTFTDVVTWAPGGTPRVRKVRSDAAVVGALAAGDLVLGTTVATNALLERTGVPTALLVTAGFADLVRLRHMARPRLFEPDVGWPPPLCARVVEVAGRLAADGTEVTPWALPALDLSDVTAVAVVLLHSHRNAAHERGVAEAIAARWPHLHVSLGHRVSPEVGYLARIETTLVDAAITPVLQAALTRDRVPDGALAIRSDGGLVAAAALRAPDAVLSGPAGGVLAVAAVAARAGVPGAVGLDMGGTSTDVCCVVGDDLPRHAGDVLVAGVAVRRAMLEVETIAAGGGSVLGHDGIRLTVGPASAGANPGPQCYGRGGPPTLTDAAVAEGLVDPGAFDPPLEPAAIALPGPAAAYLDVAREAMAAAVRRIATARGLDVAPMALVAYGGAAGQHAAAVAERLGQRLVLVHPLASALSAWGQTLAREEAVAVQALWRPLPRDATGWRALQATVDAQRVAIAGSRAWTDVTATVSLRVRGTDHALPVPWSTDPAALVAAWRAAHRAVHGLDAPADVDLELVDVVVRGRAPGVDVPWPDDDPWQLGDAVVVGPARVDCPTTSVHVPAGWRARRQDGLLRLERVDAPAVPAATTRTAHGTSLWSSRFMTVAEQSGELLARLARSVNIRERRDFSCAVFDGEGQLVANAPHIPVHLGAMGQTVRDLLAHEATLDGFTDGSAWLTNAPSAGGSHLPDLTVVTPVVRGGHRWFVASRGHHVDIGGLTPGSMPPTSRTLADEGVVLTRVRLTDGDALRPAHALRAHLIGCRQPDVVVADLGAQVAANRLAARLLGALAPPDVIAAWMAHLQDAADEAVTDALSGLPDGEATDTVDGVPLAVRVGWRGDRLRVDWTGTGGPHPGNLNAPPAVVRAAVLYALRVLVGRDVPLNEGALRHVDLVVPSPSLLAPPPDAAVVGGNVETSQRLVELLLRAWDARAAGPGTMNNLTLGGDGWSLYQTLGGGQGASPAGPGLSGLQVHMTNTRATDPEVVELRLPLRVWRHGLRAGSGGDGTHRGGDGLVHTVEVLAPCTAALLATRRHTGAPGLRGGRGLPGVDRLWRDGGWQAWDGSPTPLAPGDRVEVATPGGGGWCASGARDATSR